MVLKWGGTIVTAVKWGSTNCTVVYWGSTKVFPGYANSIVVTGKGSSVKFTITFNSGQTWGQRFPAVGTTYMWKVSGSGASVVLYGITVSNPKSNTLRFHTFSGTNSGTEKQWSDSTYNKNSLIPISNFTTSGSSASMSYSGGIGSYNTDP